jgi:CarD family transcriptional regulator
MAQKMAPSKVASKKAANKKPSLRKDSHAPASVSTKSAKAKPAVAAQAPKRTAKAAVAAKPPKPVASKTTPHAKSPVPQKAAVKSVKAPASKPHAAATPKHEAKAAAPRAPSMMPPPAGPRPAAAAAPRSMPAAVGKAASQRIIAPAEPVPAAAEPTPAPSAPAVSATAAPQPAAPAQPADKAAAAAAASKKDKAGQQKLGFKVNEWIVYPAHGVGRIVAVEEQEIAGIALELFVITFEKDKMTLRVPTGKSASIGMRKLAEEATVKKAIETLKGRARVKRTMWSRRAQEYEAKINSGDLIAIAEVVRDLYRSESQPEQSYSERQLYEAALDRMAREIAVVEKLDERGAVQRITEVLAKSARGRGVAAEAA